MKKLYIIIAIMITSLPAYAEKACMVEIKTLDNIDNSLTELNCEKGDYFTVYTYSNKKRRQLRIRTVIMQFCDLSKPFVIDTESQADHHVLATCTLSGEKRALVLDKEAETDLH